ncbi:MAG TPA: alanine racemase [Thermoanaerobaculia bacterium]|nr:alanine racemase [Thermoanaerobaculia bacterium]
MPYLDSVLRPAWLRVDLDALERNVRRLAAAVAPARVAVVVKADAYGHGAVEVGRVFEAEGAELAAVALLEEGVELRRSGLRMPILVLGTLEPGQLPVCRRHVLTPALSSLEQLALWRDFTAGSLGAPQPVHLKVDTGMSRLGVAPEEVPRALEMLRAAPELQLAGLMSHFGDADLPESPRNDEQTAAFDAVLPLLTEAERGTVTVHFANSAAGLHRPPSRFDMVRFGLALYGLDPLAGHPGPGAPEPVDGLEPVASVAARISQVRSVPAGRAAGYGSRWVAERPSRLAVVPVGYADGYPWSLTHRGEALLRGRRVAMAGAVSMDLTIFDVTDLEAAAPGRGAVPVAAEEEVVLLGRQEGEEITALELAERAGTIPWEILTRLGERLPRCYLRGGRVVAVASRFLGARR